MATDTKRMVNFFSRDAEDIMGEAIEKFSPVKIFAGFSGGDDSLALAHWMAAHFPETEMLHINTGIGIEATRLFVRETCEHYMWRLREVRALEDCGQDYDWIVRKWGFPGPAHHPLCYQRLKERAVGLVVKQTKTKRTDRVMIATGIREDESLVRAGYKGREINRNGAQVWVNPIYWWTKKRRDQYLTDHQIRRNPVSRELGISGECLCGAFAHPGELERVRAIDPVVAERIDRLHAEVKDRFPWGWEEQPPRPPRVGKRKVGQMCIGCEKSVVVQQLLFELEDDA